MPTAINNEITNSGSQKVTFDFKEPAKGWSFNHLLRGVIAPGIYKGLELEIISGNDIQITPGTVFINGQDITRATDNIAVKIETQSNVTFTASQTVPSENDIVYIVYDYIEQIQDWAVFQYDSASSFFAARPLNSIVIGEIEYDTLGNVTGFSRFSRDNGSLNDDDIQFLPGIGISDKILKKNIVLKEDELAYAMGELDITNAEFDATNGELVIMYNTVAATTGSAVTNTPAWTETFLAPSARAVSDRIFETITNPGDLTVYPWESKSYYMSGLFLNGPSGITDPFTVTAIVKDNDNIELSLRPFAIDDKTEWSLKKVGGIWDTWQRIDGRALIETIRFTDVRQTVLSGPVDANGRASYIAIGTGLQAVTTGVSASVPMVLSYGDGFSDKGDKNIIANIESNLTWSGLTANSTNYLYVDVDEGTGTATTGFTTLAPAYSYAKPSSPASGQFWYHKKHSARGEYWNGSAWTPVLRMYVGEAVTDASAVTSVVTYAYQGRADTQTAIPALGTSTNFNHNIGTDQVRGDIKLLCVSAQHGYVAGDIVTKGTETIAGSSRNIPLNSYSLGRNTISKTRSNENTYIQLSNGTEGAITAANWNYKISAWRDF